MAALVELQRCSYAGPVLAAAFTPLAQAPLPAEASAAIGASATTGQRPLLLLHSVGPDLHAATVWSEAASADAGIGRSPGTSRRCLPAPLIANAHIHGIRVFHDSHPDSLGVQGTWGALFGPHCLALFTASASLGVPGCGTPAGRSGASTSGEVDLRLEGGSPLRMPDWPLDVAVVMVRGTGSPSPQRALLVVAFARHFLELWELVGALAAQRLSRVAGPGGTSFLYTASLFSMPATGSAPAEACGGGGKLLCASGTFDSSITVWTVPTQRQVAEVATVQDEAPLESSLLADHQGAIFKVRFCLGGAALLSASDDRTARLWSRRSLEALESDAQEDGSPRGSWLCRSVMRGHGSRVWDAVIVPFATAGAARPSFGLATACEDSIVRLFALSGTCLRELHGHQIRGVRCLAVHPSGGSHLAAIDGAQPVLASGGEDGGVKLWPLVVGGTVDPGRRVVRRAWEVPHPEDWIREVALLSDVEAFVATNFGRIYLLRLGQVDDDGEENDPERDAPALGELIFESADISFTSFAPELGGAKRRLWVGGASGEGLVMTEDPCEAKWLDARFQAFQGCRVSGSFAGKDGHGALTDHNGTVTLWRCQASESGLPVPELLLSQRLPTAGARSQRVLCGITLDLPVSDPAPPPAQGSTAASWVFGDEHGQLHAVDSASVSRLASAHAGKVLTLCELHSMGGREVEPGVAMLLSGGGDGAVALHRLAKGGAWQRVSLLRPGHGLRQLAHLVPGPMGAEDAFIGAFHAADFVLWDVHMGVELWRHRCGGSKRPSALVSARPSSACGASFTFAYSSGSKSLELHMTEQPAASREGTVTAASASAPRAVRAPLHGREVHCVAWVLEPAQERPGLFVTGSEDTMFRLVPCRQSGGVDGTLEIGAPYPALRHSGAVRAVAVAEVGGEVFVVAGGAKGWLNGFLLEADCRLGLAWDPGTLRPADPAGSCPTLKSAGDTADDSDAESVSDAGAAAGGADSLGERVTAVDCTCVGTDVLTVAAVTSSGLLHLWRLSVQAGAVAASPAAGSGDASPTCARRLRVAESAALSVCCFAARSEVCVGAVVGTAAGSVVAVTDGADWRSQPPLVSTPHDAGVNDITAHLREGGGGPPRLIVATGGDDQRIALLVYQVGTADLTLLSMQCFDGMHCSSIRAVSWAFPYLLSLGLDRRLHVWASASEETWDSAASSATVSLRMVSDLDAATVMCTEPEALAVGGPTLAAGQQQQRARRRRPLLLAGRGVEVAMLNLE